MWGFALALTLVFWGLPNNLKESFVWEDGLLSASCLWPGQVTSCSEQSILQVYL